MTVELARRAAAGDLDAEVLDWITSALRKHLDGESLDVALGLSRVEMGPTDRGSYRARTRREYSGSAVFDRFR